MKKKFLSVLLIVAVLIGMAGVSGTQTESGEQKADKEQKQQENEQTAETKVEIPLENEEEQQGWIGVILNGDETEAYTLAHIDGIRAAAEKLPAQRLRRADKTPPFAHTPLRKTPYSAPSSHKPGRPQGAPRPV